MIFEYNLLDANHILDKFAGALHTEVKNNTLTYPNYFAEGYIKKVLLPSDIQILTFEYNYKQDLLVKHNADDKERYMIWFDISLHRQPIQFSIADEVTTFENIATQTAAIVCSHFSFSHLRTVGANGFGVAIILHKKILAHFIENNKWLNVLQWYFSIKSEALNLIQITAAERALVADLVNLSQKGFPLITQEKKVHQLLELYFLRLDRIYKERVGKLPLSENDIDILKNIELIIQQHYLTDKLNIKALEKEIGMTKYSLEKLCKKVLNISLVDYVKQLKLQLAYKDIIHTEKNIKEIAYEIGYANPSNFSNAFKKRFGHKPSEIR